jgi:plasmid stabilization system protein ParE
MDVIVLPRAEADAQELYERMAELAGFDRADRLAEEIAAGMALLAQHPEIGPVDSALRPLRRLILNDTRFGIYYAIEGRRLVIHGVVDLRRNRERLRERFRH